MTDRDFRKTLRMNGIRTEFITYLFSCGPDQVIDGFGTAMFINHSCDPNCETEDEDGRIFVVAIRNIAAGEELTYEYNLYDSDDEEGTCYCGATRCRGTMLSEDEVKRPCYGGKDQEKAS